MIARALVVALSCACAAALAPLAAPADDDCALYLTGPGRSSAYDYSLNLLKGNFGYEGQHTCITYEAINQAYLDARNRILVSQPKGDWKAEDFASVGELLLDISINLARTYGLTYEEIEKGLPLIDTSRTLIREACPPVFSHVECRAGKYRRFDGLCNNLRHPTWGATMAPFQRLIGPLFADGINAPRIARNGHDLPLSRVVSRTMHPDDGFHDHAGTVMVIAWGQFMDHDYTLTGTPLDPINRNDPEECCKRPPHLKHPYCNEIRVPDDDYFYRLWGVKCIDFVRGFPSPRPGCRLGSRVPFNTLTGTIDGNTVYGVTEKFARKLRTGYGGLLRMNPVFKEYGLKDLLPLKLDIPDEGCTRPNKNMYCFEAGEIRVNEQLVLTVMHTLMAREHNRVAEGLAAVNPHWDDETLFQEARRINIAEIQHITYNEFLPILLGKDVMEKFGLVLEKEGYWNGYDPEVNPDVLASFAAAAYRFGHSLLPTAVERWSKAHKFIASKRLSDLIRRPYDLYRAGVLDEYVMGLMNQVAQAMDDSITQEVTNHLFKKVGARFGMDLVSFNMQRGREFGLPGYMEFRKFCGLPGAETFQDLFGSMPNETVRKYESIFDHPVDVDLWSGGVSERPLPGSMLGPTFACIIATQFSYSRRGDRFWFELPNQPSSFTPEQLTEIRKSRLARVICDNTDIIDTVQLYPMVLPDHELNPRVPCRSGIIPSMDFSKWAEPVPFHGTAKQFITEANATNNFVKCKYVNKGNTTEENGAQNDEKIDSSLCGSLTNQLNGIVNENITRKVQINQTSRVLNENLLTANRPDDINGSKSSKGESNNINLIKNTDSLLKDAQKNTDKINLENKSKGHIKNRILRKKRSPRERRENLLGFYKSVSPTPYHISHSEKDGFVTLEDKTRDIIKDTGLADYNIETLHKDSKSPLAIKEKNNSGYYSDTDIYKGPLPIERADKKYEHHDKFDKGGNKDYPSAINSSKHPIPVKKDDRSYEQQHSDKHDKSGNNKEYPLVKDISKNPLSIKNVDKSYEQQHRDKIDKGGNYKDYPSILENSKYPISAKKEDRSYEQQDRDKFDSGEKYTNIKEGNYNEHRSEKDSSKKPHPIKEDLKSYERSREIDDRDEKNLYKSTESNSKEGDDSKEFYYGVPHKPSPLGKILNYEDSNESSKELVNDSKNTENSKSNHPKNIQKNNIVKSNYDHIEDQYRKKNPHEDSKSIENSKETSVFTKPRSDLAHENYDISNPPRAIQDVDLNDFSYERIQVNNKGQVEPLKDLHENYDSAESKHTTVAPSQISSDKYHKHYTPPTINNNPSERLIIPNEQPIRINDGEVKPVVELNSESDNSGSSEESPVRYQNSPSRNSDKYSSSEEDLHKKKINDQFNENSGEKAAVKQQFERIPLDYNHDDKSQKEDNKEKPASSKDNSDENINDGTLDSLTTKNNNYDEHLKTKFGDVSISLPEIKLPDDILSYARIGAPKESDGKYYYGEEDSDENPSDYTKSPYTDLNLNNDYYKIDIDKVKDHEDYKKASLEDDDDDDVDLYEKFVKERFGKDSLGKKSEKLQAAENRPNSKLLDTVQKLLKKTEQVKDEAEKSGDPNAGYMWTLEYGENL